MPSGKASGALRIYGHRGSRRNALENTLESFALALAEGAEGVETDVRRLADGTLVLFHDDEIAATPVETFTFAELSTAWPGLARLDSLRDFGGSAELILEIKRPGFARELVDAVAGLDRVVIASFDHRLVAELAELREQTAARFELGVTIAGSMVGGAQYTLGLGASWSFPAHTFVDGELVSEFVEAGVNVVPWTPNSPHWWERFRDWGCHGVITDLPRDARAWREAGQRP